MVLVNKMSVCALLTTCLLAMPVHAQETSRIPAAEVAALEAGAEKAQKARPRSSTQRRGYKGVVRRGKSLVAKQPKAENRFQVLGIMLKCQRILLKLEKNDRNRKTLFDICAQLTGAPDRWANVRLEADVLLSERDLAAKGASLQQRAQAIERLIKRYRGTVAEGKSLMICAVIAKNMGSDALLQSIEKIMDERCADMPKVIAFRRNVLSLKSLKVKCRGRYKRSDGVYLNIPGDRIGHQCVLVYWSQTNKASERFLKEVESERKRFESMFEVYSFNLDELPDAGEKVLRSMGLDWHAMHLPDGKRNVFYQAYGGTNPVALFVNAFGYTVLNPFGVNVDSQGWRSVNSGVFKISSSRISHDRYLAQLQSFFIGDFLVTDSSGAFDPASPPELRMATPAGKKEAAIARTATCVPEAKLKAIQESFVLSPFRYRISRKEAAEMYAKIDKLCVAALKEHPNAPDAWIVRNRRIVALLGLWNLNIDFSAFEKATQEARAVLAANVPAAAAVVARFCLTKQALRAESLTPQVHLEKMVKESGGDGAPVTAFASAAVLALEANRRELHETYRAKVLSAAMAHPMWATRTFLQNRYQRFYLLRPNTTRGDRMGWSRSYIANHKWNPHAPLLPKCTLKDLDGKALTLPDPANKRLTLLLFVEPPADPKADFPVRLDRKGKPTKNDYIRKVFSDAQMLAKTHLKKEVDVLLAFLTDDANHVKMLMKKNEWNCRAALVPGGLKSPLVQRLGILSADRMPNVFVLRRNGAVAWRNSGYVYKSEFGFPFAVLLAMKLHIEVSDLMVGLNALNKKDFRVASRYFENSFALARPDRYAWHSPRYHAHAISLMGLKDWKGALDSIEKAIDAHKLRHARGYRRSKRLEDWRKDAAIIPIKDPCDIFKELWTTKAIILEKLGREDEAAKLRKLAEKAKAIDAESLYTAFHHKLQAFRTGVLNEK